MGEAIGAGGADSVGHEGSSVGAVVVELSGSILCSLVVLAAYVC